MIGGYMVLARLNPNQYGQVLMAIVLIGAGYGIIIGPITVLAAGEFTGKLLTASQSVIGVFRQIGTSLAVAIFVSALSTNLTIAKTNIRAFAQNEVAVLPVTAQVKRESLVQVNDQLAAESLPQHPQTTFIDQAKANQLIQRHYQQALVQQRLTQASVPIKRAIYQRIERAVTRRVAHDNRTLGGLAAAIHHETKRQLTRAFMRPYRLAMPFTFAMLLAAFLFRRRRNYLERERIENDHGFR